MQINFNKKMQKKSKPKSFFEKNPYISAASLPQSHAAITLILNPHVSECWPHGLLAKIVAMILKNLNLI